MGDQEHQIEELLDLQEALELKRREARRAILEAKDAGATDEETKEARRLLAVILQELSQCKNQIIESKG
jgi:hypothetical protein